MQFYICQNVDGVCVMTELDSLRIPYIDRLYKILKTIYINYYGKDHMSTITTTNSDSSNGTLEPKILKAITDRERIVT